MEFILDSADIEKIRFCTEHLPVAGVTTNPSILGRSGRKDVFRVLEEILSLIPGRLLHVQVTAGEAEGMCREAEVLRKHFGDRVAVKVPVTVEGLTCIRALKAQGYTVTATAVYSRIQAYFAVAAGADFIAPYYNRIETGGTDAAALVRDLRSVIDREGSRTRILAASFHREEQVVAALTAGAHAVTVQPDMYIAMLSSPVVEKALTDFDRDWSGLGGLKRFFELEQ